MKAILLSLKPKWWEKMVSGEKVLEIRKTAPVDGVGGENPWPLRVLVYICGTGEVQGEFICPGWVKTNLYRYLSKQSCVPMEDLQKYAAGKSLYGWIVKKPQKYDTPRPLAEFGLERPPMSWQYVDIPDAAEVE